MTRYPPPFHLCSLSKTGTFLWFTGKTGERRKLRTNQEARDFAEQRQPGAVFVLSTMRALIGDDWNGPPNMVAMAVCDRSDLTTEGYNIVGFILGGIVPPGTPIPAGHDARLGAGCIPFDMDVWSDAAIKLTSLN
jgi:hypothetical protein